MSFLYEMFDKIIRAAEETQPFARIVYGSDPPQNGICMIPSTGPPEYTNLDKGMRLNLSVVLNGKNEDQRLLLDDLTCIHEVLTKRRDYKDLSTEAIQVVNISSVSLPTIIGREQNKQWICGSQLEVTIYWKAVEFFNMDI